MTRKLAMVFPIKFLATFILLGLFSCGPSPRGAGAYIPKGWIKENWYYWPYVEEITVPSSVKVGEEINVTMKAYFPDSVPDELSWVGVGVSELETNLSLVLSFEPGPPYADTQILFPKSGELEFSFAPFSEPTRTELGVLSAATAEDAGLIMTVTRTGGGVGPEEEALYQRYKLGDGKLKWTIFEIDILPAS